MSTVFSLVSASGRESVSGSGTVVRGYLETKGAQIVDSTSGDAVRLVGANWFGAESSALIPGGLWARNYQNMMDQMVDAGINTLRIPLSPEVLTNAIVTSGFRADLNPDLVGLTPLQILDKIVDYAGDIGLRIVLGMHRIDAGVGKQESGLWFGKNYSLDNLAADWQTIVARYTGDPTVVGVDVFNEPSDKARWGDESSAPQYDWSAAATTLGNAVLDVNPNLLVLVQGIHVYENKWYWVGGNLRPVASDPIVLNVADRVVYSPHDYPSSVQNVPWLEGATTAQMIANFEKHWGYIYDQGLAPILIGETGARLTGPADTRYLDALFSYLEAKNAASPGGAGGVGLTWWGWNPNSGDTGGLLDDAWQFVNPVKAAYLERITGEPMPIDTAAAARTSENVLTFELASLRNLSADRTYYYTIEGGTATEGVDFLARDGVIRLRPGQTTVEIDVTILADKQSEGDETVFLNLFWTTGQQLARFEGVIRDTPPPPPPISPDSAEKVKFFGDTKLTLTSVADPTGGFDLVATLEDKFGRDLPAAWSMRVAPKDATAQVITVADPNVVVQDRKGGALLLTPDATADASNSRSLFDTLSAPLTAADRKKAVVTIDVDLLKQDAFRFDAVLDWDAQRIGQGYGETTTRGGGFTRSSDLDVDFVIEQTWGDFFFGRVAISNTGVRTITDWGIDLTGVGFDILQTHTVSGGVTTIDDAKVDAPTWNRDLDPGETFVFGLNGVHRNDEVSLNPQALLDQIDVLLV